MKKAVSFLLTLALLAGLLSAWAAGPAGPLSVYFYDETAQRYGELTQTDRVSLTLDGSPLTPDDVPALVQYPAGQNGRTLVPVRLIAERLGASVTWVPETRQVILLREESTIVLTLGSATALVNGQAMELPGGVPAGVVKWEGRESTMVPLRFVSEQLGATVDWDNDTFTAILTSPGTQEPFAYDDTPYKARVYFGVGRPDPGQELVFGPNIADWPEQVALPENLLLTVCSAIYDPVTTTDELIPSGETSSYRSNPVKLSEFTLSRKDPQYVPRAKEVLAVERLRRTNPGDPRVGEALLAHDPADTGLGSLVMALKPGDGSAREQAASCQRVLGGAANLAAEYATKRYRSNVVNWGMLPFIAEDVKDWNLQPGDRIYLPGIRAAVDGGAEEVPAVLLQNGAERPVTLKLPGMTREERDIVLAGCLINYYAK